MVFFYEFKCADGSNLNSEIFAQVGSKISADKFFGLIRAQINGISMKMLSLILTLRHKTCVVL